MTSGLAMWQSILAYCAAPCYFLLAFLLYRRGLWRSYLFFFLYLLIEGAAFAAGLVYARSRRISSYIYLFAQPLLMLFYVLMVLEVFRKVFARFPGVARFAQRFILGSLLAALFIGFLTAAADMPASGGLLFKYTVATRVVSFSLCLYLLLVVAFLVWMPVPLPRNTIRHGFFFFFYFLCIAMAHLSLNRMGLDVRLQVNLALTALTLCTLLLWTWFLDRAGEAVPASQATSRSASTYFQKLEAINKSLETSSGPS